MKLYKKIRICWWINFLYVGVLSFQAMASIALEDETVPQKLMRHFSDALPSGLLIRAAYDEEFYCHCNESTVWNRRFYFKAAGQKKFQAINPLT
jgi:hypothetical protein